MLVGGGWPVAAQSSLVKEFAKLIEAQCRAIAAADTAVLSPMLAKNLVWILGPSGSSLNRGQLLAAVGQRQSPQTRFEVDSVHVRRAGAAVS